LKNNFFKTFLSLLLILVASFSFAQNIDDLKFEKTTQKFMKVDEGHRITLNYTFTYSGKVPLKILEPKLDCSCTEIIFPEKSIEPNSSHAIIIKFNTTDKIGWQEREVIIQFVSDYMDSRNIAQKLTFKGMVKASKATKEAYKANMKKR
jgi:hypothetical protein